MPKETKDTKKKLKAEKAPAKSHISFRPSPATAFMLDELISKAKQESGIEIGRTAIIERSIREAAEKRGITA